MKLDRHSCMVALSWASVVSGGPRTAQNCVHDVAGFVFDLSPMATAGKPHQLQKEQPGGNHTYLAAICDVLPSVRRECKIPDAVASIDNSCKFLGRASDPSTYQLLDGEQPELGVKVTYGNGAMCEVDVSLKDTVTFLFYCDPDMMDQDTMFTDVHGLSESSTECNWEFEFHTAYACPTKGERPARGGGNVAATVVISMVFFMGTYCIVGASYKLFIKGASGVESVPHVDCMRSVGSALPEICLWLVGLSEAAVGGLRRRFKGKPRGGPSSGGSYRVVATDFVDLDDTYTELQGYSTAAHGVGWEDASLPSSPAHSGPPALGTSYSFGT